MRALVSGGRPVTDSLAARQLYARHLYVLALALADTGAILTDLKKTNPAATSDDVTRMIAQWAVNVVAYRDHNGIMIPFPYDPNPFSGNGWNPDNTPSAHGLGMQAARVVDHGDLGLPRPADAGPQQRSASTTKKPGAMLTGARSTRVSTTDTDPQEARIPASIRSSARKVPCSSSSTTPGRCWSRGRPISVPVRPRRPTGRWRGRIDQDDAAAVNGTIIARLEVGDRRSVDPIALSTTAASQRRRTARPRQSRSWQTGRRSNGPPISSPSTGMTYPTPGDGQVSYCPSAATPSRVVVPPSGYAVVGSGDPNQQQSDVYRL